MFTNTHIGVGFFDIQDLMEKQTSYVETLKCSLTERQKKNPKYSLRALARDLDMPPSTLSLVFKGERELPKKKVRTVVDFLNLSPQQETLFKEDYYRKRHSIDKVEIAPRFRERLMLDETYFNILSEWEYYAFLTLMECEEFQSNKTWISKRLGISVKRTSEIISGLKKAKLIAENENDEFFLLNGPLRTTEDVTSKALQKSHLETLDIGKEKLQSVPVELRDFSSINIAVDISKLEEAKTIIREFRHKMASLLRDGEKEEVYQLAIQLYPLTEIQNKMENSK